MAEGRLSYVVLLAKVCAYLLRVSAADDRGEATHETDLSREERRLLLPMQLQGCLKGKINVEGQLVHLCGAHDVSISCPFDILRNRVGSSCCLPRLQLLFRFAFKGSFNFSAREFTVFFHRSLVFDQFGWGGSYDFVGGNNTVDLKMFLSSVGLWWFALRMRITDRIDWILHRAVSLFTAAFLDLV